MVKGRQEIIRCCEAVVSMCGFPDYRRVILTGFSQVRTHAVARMCVVSLTNFPVLSATRSVFSSFLLFLLSLSECVLLVLLVLLLFVPACFRFATGRHDGQ
jgi:hypothetical protein